LIRANPVCLWDRGLWVCKFIVRVKEELFKEKKIKGMSFLSLSRESTKKKEKKNNNKHSFLQQQHHYQALNGVKKKGLFLCNHVFLEYRFRE
jgi:hypothetical protein